MQAQLIWEVTRFPMQCHVVGLVPVVLGTMRSLVRRSPSDGVQFAVSTCYGQLRPNQNGYDEQHHYRLHRIREVFVTAEGSRRALLLAVTDTRSHSDSKQRHHYAFHQTICKYSKNYG